MRASRLAVIARVPLPPHYVRWNRRWGAPSGRALARRLVPRRWRTWRWFARACGPFAFQGNNTTREFEYPWAFEQVDPRPGLRVLEIGGGYSGLQFVLARHGCDVVNVDPGTASWPLDPARFDALNRAFGTRVQLRRCTLAQAGLPAASFDRVLSVSVLEHLGDDEAAEVLDETRRVLRPGGRCVLTIDLFLDVEPFARRERNAHGRNVSVRALVERSGMRLVHGDPRELVGFADFDPQRIAASLPQFVVGRRYPVLVQTVVLERPADG
ncbi:MAG: class I SAM-dependent methyltransferase [Myxococcota bacterium]|nr:class I SAM-dependent methyltransferase [Myxococcota bacterium]MDW8362257.1 class I SAM-dependent methyltransferase [Myxococcales bacterium]